MYVLGVNLPDRKLVKVRDAPGKLGWHGADGMNAAEPASEGE
jgi:hypothetical protein